MKREFNSREELKSFIAEEIVYTAEACEILECSRQNLYYLIKRGHLIPIKEMNNDRIFLKQDIIDRKNRKNVD